MRAASAGPEGAVRWDRIAPLALVVLSLPVLFLDLGSYSVVSSDEAVFQVIARNMVRSGDWLRVEFDGEVYTFLLSSPLHFWLRAALISVAGDSPWTMRLPSAVFGALAVLATYRLARRRRPVQEAFLSGFVLLTTFQFVYLHGARTGELDAMACFLFAWIAHDFLVALETGRSFLRHHVAMILLMNLKLPLVLIPALVEGTYLLVRPERRGDLRRWAAPLVVLVPLGLAWHVFQYGRDPAGSGYVLRQMVERLYGAASLPTGAAFYGRVLLQGMFPYCMAAPVALLWRYRTDDPRTSEYQRLLRFFTVGTIGFFVIVGSRFPWYVIPSYPFLACLVSRWLLVGIRAGSAAKAAAAAGVLAAIAATGVWDLGEPLPARHLDFPPASWNWPTALGAAGALAAATFAAIRMRRGAAWNRNLAWVCLATLVVLGAVRTAAPLSSLRYESRTAALSRKLSARLAAGETLRFPIVIPACPEKIRTYYFGDTFRWERAGNGLPAHLTGLIAAPSSGPVESGP